MPWKELEHTADMGLEITARTMEDLVIESADALYRVMFQGVCPGAILQEHDILIRGNDLVEIMVSWMNELLFLYDTRTGIFIIRQVHLEPLEKVLHVKGALYEAPYLITYVKAATYGSVLLLTSPPFFRVYLDL